MLARGRKGVPGLPPPVFPLRLQTGRSPGGQRPPTVVNMSAPASRKSNLQAAPNTSSHKQHATLHSNITPPIHWQDCWHLQASHQRKE
jgi:hypothetical protein